MYSTSGCFEACFSTLTSSNFKPNSQLSNRPQRIKLDSPSSKDKNSIHSLSKKKFAKNVTLVHQDKKADALMMVIHNKIGNNINNIQTQKKTPKNVEITPIKNSQLNRYYSNSYADSNFKSFPDQRSTHYKDYFSVNPNDEKNNHYSIEKDSQKSQNSNSKVQSFGSQVKMKKCEMLLIESRLKAKLKQQKIKIEEKQQLDQNINKKINNYHTLKNTKNLRYSMIQSSSNSKDIQTAVKSKNLNHHYHYSSQKKPQSSTGRTQQKYKIKDIENIQTFRIYKKQHQSQLFHNLTPSSLKKTQKSIKQSFISLNKKKCNNQTTNNKSNVQISLNKRTVQSHNASQSPVASKMSIINKIIIQDERKSPQLSHINLIKIPNLNQSYTIIPLEDDFQANQCFLKKKPFSQNQTYNAFNKQIIKNSPMDKLTDQSLGFFNDYSPERSIELTNNNCEVKEKLQCQIVKNKFNGLGRFFNNHTCIIKQTGFVFNMKEVSTVTIKSHGIQHKIYETLDVLTRLSHPNVLKIYYASNCKNKFTIYQQFGQGNLDDQLSKNQGRFKEMKAVKVLRDILKGLSYIHSYAGQGYTHKSLKPKNIIFVNDTAKIEWLGYQDSMISSYISPQMRRASPYNKKNDIWSVGIIAYVMIYGTMPHIDLNFEPKKIQEVDQQKQSESVKQSIIYESQGKKTPSQQKQLSDIIQSKSVATISQIPKQFNENEQIIISLQYEDFLMKTLQQYQRNRMTAIECLAHPLIRKYEEKEIQIL